MLSRAAAFPRLCTRKLHTSTSVLSGSPEWYWGPEKAAGREYVGHGATGDNTYTDRLDYWYPAIRFRVEDATIKPVRAKEQGDWKSLSVEEKKQLYRHSFRQTLAEFEAPSAYWKLCLAMGLSVLALATAYATFLNNVVYPPIPPTFQDEYKEAQIMRTIVLEKGAFLGPASKWDYENNRWK
ncbi:unnamed protein product, partial [Mesorhabditis spiculigera]